MTKKHEELLAELYSLAPPQDTAFYKDMTAFLTGLGYMPKREIEPKFDLSFTHSNGAAIAKIGFYKNKFQLRIKFFACANVPPKYIQILKDEAEAENKMNRFARRGAVPVPSPPPGVFTKKCLSGDCKTCGRIRYYVQSDNGNMLGKCSGEPVPVPDISGIDRNELKRLVTEQHGYFMVLLK